MLIVRLAPEDMTVVKDAWRAADAGDPNPGQTRRARTRPLLFGELSASKPNGAKLVLRRVAIDPDDGSIERRNAERGVVVGSTTCEPTWYGDPLDLDRITTSLMQQWEREHPESRA